MYTKNELSKKQASLLNFLLVILGWHFLTVFCENINNTWIQATYKPTEMFLEILNQSDSAMTAQFLIGTEKVMLKCDC